MSEGRTPAAARLVDSVCSWLFCVHSGLDGYPRYCRLGEAGSCWPDANHAGSEGRRHDARDRGGTNSRCRIGPVSVDLARQGQGIGRALMGAVISAGKERGFSHPRLQQDAANMPSLALYASLGFVFQEATVVMEARPFLSSNAGARQVRLAIGADLEAIDRLSERHLTLSRRHEVAAALAHGFVALVHEDGDGFLGYFIAGRRGHGFSLPHQCASSARYARMHCSATSSPPAVAPAR